jgi:hypothetical protein
MTLPKIDLMKNHAVSYVRRGRQMRDQSRSVSDLGQCMDFFSAHPLELELEGATIPIDVSGPTEQSVRRYEIIEAILEFDGCMRYEGCADKKSGRPQCHVISMSKNGP